MFAANDRNKIRQQLGMYYHNEVLNIAHVMRNVQTVCMSEI